MHELQRLHHAGAAQLVDDLGAVEDQRLLHLVGLDAADEVRGGLGLRSERAREQSRLERGEGKGERKTRCSKWGLVLVLELVLELELELVLVLELVHGAGAGAGGRASVLARVASCFMNLPPTVCFFLVRARDLGSGASYGKSFASSGTADSDIICGSTSRTPFLDGFKAPFLLPWLQDALNFAAAIE